MVLKRLIWETETSQVVCRGRRSRRGRSEVRWDVLEFLARVVDHIPEPSQQTVRYWGFYANAELPRKVPPFSQAVDHPAGPLIRFPSHDRNNLG